jgi:glycosyltransferase involved in cell wall biosynthesis
MKIALVAPTQIPARRANTVQVMKMAQALTLLGHTVHLASPCPPGFSPPTWDELAVHYGLQTRFQVEWLASRPSLKRYDYSLRALGWARRLHADLLYTRLMQTAALASLLGMPTLLEVHDLPSGFMGPLFFKLFLYGKGARRLAVITHALAEDLHQKFDSPALSDGAMEEAGVKPTPSDHSGFTIVAPDGVDLGRYANLPTPVEARRRLIEEDALPLQLETFTAGYTGHLYTGRGVDMLIELANRLPGLQFLIVGGEPNEVQRVRAQVASLNLHNLLLTGFVANARLPLYQAACDALLMPYGQKVSASSGGDIARYFSPMKLFEYLACQRPILSSDLAVLREVLDEQNALLLPVQDVSAWERALRKLSEQPQHAAQLAEQAHRSAENFTWEKRAARMLEALEQGNV